ncbi:DgaE family pyridoxal phosphate-dependent ammonia lyase [Vibrio sp. S11_S32]|uniref:DgaE family pyridoxal phosphate-dependent ammonia lyase n=1 Tax=Vibrio sp. S11_S32 TaxID=2720225 RepID=UPI001680BC4B|nr:DgaE family pyridoxal phosphate-dependent ammonia lyase [Vibrio sp. S11_S32]MBD1576500.1 DgaE family pyridoxal phosphate-dependent ammonia lyase [Vibrio sp. S11_S32]
MSSIHNKYQLNEVINGSGRMTILGVSTPSDSVTQAVNLGLSQYFEIKDLVIKTGEYIADLLEAEAAVVVSCASAGIAQSIAAVIVKDDQYRLENLHAHSHDVPTEIVLPKGHNVNFGAPIGTMVTLGGGTLKEAGYANECTPEHLAAAITPNTAAIFYVKSHHCVQKSILSVGQAAAVAKAHNLPLIVDAAAEGDLKAYYNMGADLVLYSGAKAIEGPTSGLVVGRKQYVDWVRLQSHGIGRAMKVGKEGILGLTQAISDYYTRHHESGEEMIAKMGDFLTELNRLNGIEASVTWDSAGRDIARTQISFDEAALGKTTPQIVEALKLGSPAVYCRGYKANEGKIEIDVRSVSKQQLVTVCQKLRTIIE